MSSQTKNPGLVLAFSSALFYSLGDTGVRLTVGSLSVLGLVFLRGVAGVVVITIVAKLLGKKLWGAHTRLLALIGLSAFLATCLTFTAISRIPLYQALVILYLYPIMSLGLAALINGEAVSAGDGLRALLALGGCLLLVWPDEAAGLVFDFGHPVGLAGCMFYSLSIVLTRRLGSANSGLEPLFFYSLNCILGALLLALFFGVELNLKPDLKAVQGLLVISLTGVGQFLGFSALRWLPAHTVGTIATLEIAIGALFSWLFFHDPMTVRAVFGGCIILSAALSVRARA
jgi:drug/metabolite transporter (DMT)-like permease